MYTVIETTPVASLDGIYRYLRHRRDKAGVQFTYEIIIVDDGSKDNTSG